MVKGWSSITITSWLNLQWLVSSLTDFFDFSKAHQNYRNLGGLLTAGPLLLSFSSVSIFVHCWNIYSKYPMSCLLLKLFRLYQRCPNYSTKGYVTAGFVFQLSNLTPDRTHLINWSESWDNWFVRLCVLDLLEQKPTHSPLWNSLNIFGLHQCYLKAAFIAAGSGVM